MANLTSALLDGMRDGFPNWKEGTRPSHTTGIGVTGTFRGTPHAHRFCGAQQFNTDWTSVSVRFSNSLGEPSRDPDPDVRGMAVKFHNEGYGTDSEGFDTDLICLSTPMFMVNTPEDFLGFEAALKPAKVRRLSLGRRMRNLYSMIEVPENSPGTMSIDSGLMAWASKYRPGQSFMQTFGTVKWVWSQKEGRLVHASPPASYARIAYHAVHAFKIVGTDNVERWGRFSFEPASGVRDNFDDELSDDYLRTELKDRIERFPTRFNLRMYVADPEDDTSDPTKVWPTNRKRVLMGTLELNAMASDGDGPDIERMSFNPGRLENKFMSPSDDPVLAARIDLYNESQRRRGAVQCPVSTGPQLPV